jgi:plastocyanin
MCKFVRGNAASMCAAILGSLALVSAVVLGMPRYAFAGTARSTSAWSTAQQGTKPAPGVVVLLHRRVVQFTIHNFAFSPARIEVSPGAKLVWTNTDSDPHTVDSSKGIWSSEALDTGQHFSRVFGKVGTFTYYCSIHPFMQGTVIVKR